MKYPHLEDLEALVEKRFVSKRPHPSLPLSIYNYTPSVMSLKIEEWSEALQDARGLILENGTGEIFGRPFRKFWNYEQVLDKIPSGEDYTVWEKLDGSLGIVCEYHMQYVIATRGSFESEQAQWARQWFMSNWPTPPLPNHTFLFEIIYPRNRIIVNYGDRAEMVLLAIMDNNTGQERRDLFETSNWPKAKVFNWNFKDPAALAQMERYHPGEEGFVVRWRNGFRAKVKFEEYKRLHRLITQVSTRSIWELLRAGKSTSELIDKVPDDFRAWVNDQINKLVDAFAEIEIHVRRDFHSRPSPFKDRKAFAEWAKAMTYPNLLFAWLDEKSTEDMIWRMVEPKWSTPFRKDMDA